MNDNRYKIWFVLPFVIIMCFVIWFLISPISFGLAIVIIFIWLFIASTYYDDDGGSCDLAP